MVRGFGRGESMRHFVITAAKFGAMILLAQGVAAQVAPVSCIGVGDVVQVSIYETAPTDGIQPGNFVTLPTQTIGPSGTFSVPFAGDINAAGRSLPEIRRDIETKLANRAITPKVEVALIAQHSTGHCLPP